MLEYKHVKHAKSRTCNNVKHRETGTPQINMEVVVEIKEENWVH